MVKVSHFVSKVDAIAVDSSVSALAQANIIPPGSTFDDLSGSVLQNITGSAKYHEADKIDIDPQQYSDRSIKYHKQFHRKSTGFGNQVSFDGNTAVPDDIGQTLLTDGLFLMYIKTFE